MDNWKEVAVIPIPELLMDRVLLYTPPEDCKRPSDGMYRVCSASDARRLTDATHWQVITPPMKESKR